MERAIAKFRIFSETRRGEMRGDSLCGNLSEDPALRYVKEKFIFVSKILPLNTVLKAKNKGKAKTTELSPFHANMSCCIFTYS